jgi:hypothetical protein
MISWADWVVKDLDILRAVRVETSHTNPKCKRGNGLTPSLTLRVSVPSGRVQYNVVIRSGARYEARWRGLSPKFDRFIPEPSQRRQGREAPEQCTEDPDAQQDSRASEALLVREPPEAEK